MTACVIESAAETESMPANMRATQSGCVITADGSYAARLTRTAGAATSGEATSGEAWFPERWTLDGPEPYAVPLPGDRPEAPGTEVLPLTDGRVLIHRPSADRHMFSLLYPTGPGTGELPLGAIERPDDATELRLLPPVPDGSRACALLVGPSSSAVWLVAGGALGPELLAEVPGRCTGGVWLDRTGRLLALDRAAHGQTKTVALDLESGTVTPLLQLTDDSDDRLLLADPDSGLLLISSDAPSPGRAQLGWGVLGSMLPVRFPESLRLTVPPSDPRAAGGAPVAVTPFAIQPGQLLTPESCAVALRIDATAGSWIGLWRPVDRRVHQVPAPEGWLTGTGFWTQEGVLHLPYVTGAVPCGVARMEAPTGAGDPDRDRGASATGEAPSEHAEPDPPTPPASPSSAPRFVRVGEALAGGRRPPARRPLAEGPLTQRPLAGGTLTQDPLAQGPFAGEGEEVLAAVPQAPVHTGGPRPVPLQQAPLTGRVADERQPVAAG
ncbi:hypothetical protein [Streptomyces cavernae]|uniref:hypothetical protein n=1 Tax=Streptomyces cavernae TaxID=2259034 RepID=UPI000FEB7120|nr:hypothetical protein [Streptomyces cavernae]